MLKHPFSITMFGDSMYWTDWDRNAIFQANKFTGQNASLVANSSMVITNTLTPGKNKLFRKNEFRTNGRLHENRGVKSFSQLWDEHISTLSKQGPSYTGLAKPPNLPKNWRIWWFGRACVARPSLGRWQNMLISELDERFYAPVFMEASVCPELIFSK